MKAQKLEGLDDEVSCSAFHRPSIFVAGSVAGLIAVCAAVSPDCNARDAARWLQCALPYCGSCAALVALPWHCVAHLTLSAALHSSLALAAARAVVCCHCVFWIYRIQRSYPVGSDGISSRSRSKATCAHPISSSGRRLRSPSSISICSPSATATPCAFVYLARSLHCGLLNHRWIMSHYDGCMSLPASCLHRTQASPYGCGTPR